MRRPAFMRQAALLAAAALVLFGFPSEALAAGPGEPYPEGMTAEQYEALRDRELNFDEIGPLIETGNPMYVQYYELYAASAEDLAASYGAYVLETQQTIEASEKLISRMEEQLSLPGESNTLLASSIRQMKKTNGTLLKNVNSIGRSMQRAPAMVKGRLGTLEYQLQSAMEGLFLQELQVEAGLSVAKKQVEVLTTVLELRRSMQEKGLATSLETEAAASQLEAAKDSLAQAESGLRQLRDALGRQLGMDMEGAVLGGLPEPYLLFPETRDVAADREKAITSSAEMIAAQKAADGNQYSFDLRDMRVNEMRAKLAARFDELYTGMLADRRLYEAALVTNDLAERNMASAERQLSLGLLGNAEYQSLMIRALGQKLSFETARINYLRSMGDYRWAVKGVLSAE